MKFYDYNTDNVEELSEIIRKEEFLLLQNNRTDAEKLLKELEEILELDEYIYLDSQEIKGTMYYFLTYLDYDRKKVIQLIEDNN